MLGLIAGGGRLPLDLARAARRDGWRVVAVALRGQTDRRIEAEVERVTWLHPGEVRGVVEALRGAGARDAVLAGKLPKLPLVGDKAALKLDTTAAQLLRQLPDLGDRSILGLIAGQLELQGIRLRGQAELVPELLAREGALGRTAVTPAQAADIAFGWPIARSLADLDVGQALAVVERAVLAVEAIEGTDAMIRRAGELGAGACVVKVARSEQDPRFDLPVIGPETAAALIEAKASALAFEAGQTLVLDREALVEAADAHGIALLGVHPERLPGAAQAAGERR